MPAIAAAAFARIRAETELMPATSTTEAASSRSLAPTIGRVSPAAIVETISFGTPTGSARMASAAIEVLPEPPAASTPSQRPSACRRATTAVAPRAIASTACPRSPAARSASTSAPAAAATCSLLHVGLDERRPHDAGVDEDRRDSGSVQPIAQERVLAALRVERSDEHDCRVCHRFLLRFQARRYSTGLVRTGMLPARPSPARIVTRLTPDPAGAAAAASAPPRARRRAP